MRFFSKSGLMLTAAVLFTSVAWANQADTSDTSTNWWNGWGNSVSLANQTGAGATAGNWWSGWNNRVSQANQTVTSATANTSTTKEKSVPTANQTYIATGTTDKKTATMLVNLLRNPDLKVKAEANISRDNVTGLPQISNDPTYTAHGKVDKKTALLLVNLLRNPHLTVKADVNYVAKNPQGINNAGMDYSISGKTDPKTIEKLRALLQQSKQVSINVKPNANNSAKSSRGNLNGGGNPAAQQYFYQDYNALISKGRSFYHNGRPPVFIQGSTLWYPVPVTNQANSKLSK